MKNGLKIVFIEDKDSLKSAVVMNVGVGST